MSIGELGMRNVVSLHCDSERVSHRFAQILSLQATVLTKLRSNRYFSARELRIDFTEHELHELHEYVA